MMIDLRLGSVSGSLFGGRGGRKGLGLVMATAGLGCSPMVLVRRAAVKRRNHPPRRQGELLQRLEDGSDVEVYYELYSHAWHEKGLPPALSGSVQICLGHILGSLPLARALWPLLLVLGRGYITRRTREHKHIELS